MAKKKEEPKVNAPSGALPTPRLRGKYKDEVLPKLQEQFKYKSVMQVPKLDKIVINMGTGSTDKDSKHIENSIRDLALISGQKPITTHAKKAISNFKLREGMKVGCKVTLRGDVMYEFVDRLITMALPRVRDFRGINPKSFDGRGNYAMGMKEHVVFLEIDYDKTESVWGMDIVFNTTAKTDEEARALLEGFQFPFTN